MLAVGIVSTAFLTGCAAKDNGAERQTLSFVQCDSIALSELFACDGIRSVELEDPDSVWITNPVIVRMTDRYIAACQAFGAQRGVWLFASDGKYLGEVGRIGRGPDEYTYPMDMLFDPTGDTLFVEDKGRKVMLAYSLPDRRVRASYPFTFNSKCATIDPDNGEFIWHVSTSNLNVGKSFESFVRTNRQGEVIAQASPVEQKDSYSGMFNTLTLFHDTPEGVVAHYQFQPEIFSVSGSAEPVSVLSFENHEFLPSSFDWHGKDFRERIIASPYVQYYDVFETTRQLHVRFAAGKKIYLGIYDKQRKEGRYCETTRIRDDLGVGWIPRIMGVHNDQFYCAIFPGISKGWTKPGIIWFGR